MPRSIDWERRACTYLLDGASQTKSNRYSRHTKQRPYEDHKYGRDPDTDPTIIVIACRTYCVCRRGCCRCGGSGCCCFNNAPDKEISHVLNGGHAVEGFDNKSEDGDPRSEKDGERQRSGIFSLARPRRRRRRRFAKPSQLFAYHDTESECFSIVQDMRQERNP